MKPSSIQAVEMVRTIRDAMYEETKDLSREELKAFFARESAALRQESPQSDGTSEPGPSADARARRLP
jgi:hypothetical protein